MTKFKVGDKVRILHTDYTDCGLDVGTVHSVTAIYVGLAHLRAVYKSREPFDLCFFDSELEHADEDVMIEVGKTYTSKNGHEWLCIAVDGEYAHMRMNGVPHAAAYCFKTDGTNISQGGGEWDVRFEPVRETIAVEGSFDRGFNEHDYITLHHDMGDHKFTMTIDMVNGEPDWSSAKLTGS